MPQETNPFTKVYNTLERMLLDNDAFTSLVKEGNLIAFNIKKQPIRSAVQAGNLPEVMITAVGATEANLFATSNSSDMVRRYSFLVSTGDLRIVEKLQPVEFAIMCAMASWKENLGALTWREKPFVKRVNITDSVVGITDAELNRGVEGWTAIISLDILMYFKTQDLKDNK